MPKVLKATPEKEDFRGKYTQGETSVVAKRLLDGYFLAVEQLLQSSGLARRKSASAIEIGCGEGFSTQRIRNFLPAGVSLEASEYVQAQLPHARERNPGLTITQESIYELQHASGSYDVVFLLEVMEHLDHPKKALSEVSRILKKDGYLIVGVPREPLWRALNMSRGKYLKELGNTPGHLNHWSHGGKKMFIEQNFGPVLASKKPIPWTILLAKNHHRSKAS